MTFAKRNFLKLCFKRTLSSIRPLYDYTYTGKVKQKAKDSDDEEEDDEEVNYQYTVHECSVY